MVRKTKYFKYSILMIIPLIGFIMGIIILRKGIIRREKILCYIGVSGILISIFFYTWAFYYGTHSEKAKEEQVFFTQYQLNKAMQEVEVFKLEKGVYPESLQQLYSLDKYAPIIDPISQSLFSKKFNYFNYKKIGAEHYTIYSSGCDQIPNNTDDIFPDLSNIQSKKFGYIQN